MTMKVTQNTRGFMIGEFLDAYHSKCSIQESSSAMYDAIWLGINDADPKIMVSDAIRMGILDADKRTGEDRNGWMKYPLSDEVSLNTRMHLTQEMVQALLPTLQVFAETGQLLPTDEYSTWKEKFPDAKIERGMIQCLDMGKSPEIYFSKEFLEFASNNPYGYKVIDMFRNGMPPQDIIGVLCAILKQITDQTAELRSFQPHAPMIINMDWNTAPDWVKEKFINSK